MTSAKWPVGMLRDIMDRVPTRIWEAARASSAASTRHLRGFEWWNNKYYRNNDPNDGFREQVDARGRREIPYQRELFHPCPDGRFSLGVSGPVAYFSSDFATNCCETMDEFREVRDLKGIDLLSYLQGHKQISDGLYGYPVARKIADGAQLLDMHRPAGALMSFIVDHGLWKSVAEFTDQVLRSWDPVARIATQAIAQAASQRGFDAILYESVRLPVDLTLPDWNLVVFQRKVIVSDDPR